MSRITSEEMEGAAVRLAAELMAAAARTAPKTRGLDSIETLVVDGEELQALAKAMEAKVEEKSNPLKFFARDADSVRRSAAVLLIGVTGEPKKPHNPFNCGACGYVGCAEFISEDKREGEDFRGPICLFQALDLGIALGSAARTAAELNIDNRMMYSIGAAARKLEFMDTDIVIGFPLSVSGKSPYFDR